MRLPLWVDGDGPPVVLVHGRGEAHSSWDPVLPHLVGYRTMRVDLPGFGAAPTPPEVNAYSIPAAAAALAETLRDLDMPFALVGHSMGGMVAAAFATAHPECLSALVLESTAGAYPYGPDHFPEQGALLDRLADLADEGGMDAVGDHLNEAYGHDSDALAPWRQIPPHVFSASIRQGRRMPDLHAALSKLSVPTLVVAGQQDDAYLPWCARLARTVPGATLVTVADAGHTPHVEAPAEFGAHLRAFIDVANGVSIVEEHL